MTASPTWARFGVDQRGPKTTSSPKRPRKSNSTSIRPGADLERRLRRLAELKGTSSQTLLKEFVLERVYGEDKRLGVV